MRVNTTRFGELDIAREDIITFKDGPLGFEHLLRFFVVDPNDATLILWLQSADDPAIAFPILEPKIFLPNYQVNLLPSELASLNIVKAEEISVYAILTIPQDIRDISANLKAPIVINRSSRMARQIVLQDSKLDLRFKIYLALKSRIAATQAEKGDLSDAPSVRKEADLT